MKTIVPLFLLLALSFNALASGGFGGYNSSFSHRSTDHRYETGKSIFKGRHSAYRGVKTCIKDTASNKVVKLKSKHLASYKRGAASALFHNLYNCARPDQKLADFMRPRDASLLMYYLNKRYKLKLS